MVMYSCVGYVWFLKKKYFLKIIFYFLEKKKNKFVIYMEFKTTIH